MKSAADDRALLERTFRGDETARKALVLKLLPTVEARVRAVLLRYRSPHDVDQVADDMTQQLFLSLFDNGAKRLRAWDPERAASLSTFVGLIAEREVISCLRRPARNPFKETAVEPAVLEIQVGHDDGVERRLLERDLADRLLDRALGTLDEDRLVIFQRLVLDEEDVDVVATEAGTTRSALHMWKSRFMKVVRQMAEELTAEPGAPAAPPAPAVKERPQTESARFARAAHAT
jgi:RNA polymerase sigma factor (sigma-70 family)